MMPVWVRVLVRSMWATLAVAVFVFSAIGALVMPLGLMITWSLFGLAIGAAVGKGLLPKNIRAHPSIQQLVARGEPNARTATAAAVGFVLTCLAVTGLVAVTGAAATAELLGCCITAVAFAAWRRWHAPSTPQHIRVPATPAPATRPVPVIPVDALPIDELCLAWRRSYLQLQRAADEPTRQQLTRARQAYLDELERRDRPGFTRWLDSGARPGGDPSRYLTAGG
jgi:hypothetical protein